MDESHLHVPGLDDVLIIVASLSLRLRVLCLCITVALIVVAPSSPNHCRSNHCRIIVIEAVRHPLGGDPTPQVQQIVASL